MGHVTSFFALCLFPHLFPFYEPFYELFYEPFYEPFIFLSAIEVTTSQ